MYLGGLLIFFVCLIFLLFFLNELLYEVMGRIKRMQVGALCAF